MMRAIRLITILLCVSYFTGLFWYIYCDLVLVWDPVLEQNPHFKSVYNLSSFKIEEVMTLLTYFAFTTLSTVGLGDFTP